MTAIVLALATYRRPDDLAATLPPLIAQAATVQPPAEILVVDNDAAAGAQPVVERFAATAQVPVRYVVEPAPGIAAARNRALAEAPEAELLVFLDDDEHPVGRWLLDLLDTWRETGAAAVAGPVISEFEVPLDPWLEAGRFFSRRRLPTGTPITLAATNNLLLDLARVRELGLRFDERFGTTGGSDTLFTQQLHRAGARMVWCDTAIVIDRVPRARITRSWVLGRAFRTGNSGSRVALALASTPAARGAVRFRASVRGSLRIAGGGLRWARGRVTGSLADQARGLRTVRRGSGMIAGAFGSVYSEYARPVEHPSGTAR